MSEDLFDGYIFLLNDLKQKIAAAKLRATNLVNAELLQAYWEIGQIIAGQEGKAGWGTKVIEKLSKDLKIAFYDAKGFSPRNLRYMRDFFEAYPFFPFLQAPLANSEIAVEDPAALSILQAPLAKLSWYNHITLITKVKDETIRAFYIIESAKYNWTRDNLVHQIESQLHKRQGSLQTNFKTTIDLKDQEAICQVFKDPYKLDFLSLGPEAKERHIEDALIDHITKFLIELGQSFAFMGRQYRIQLGEKEYFYDLLFYHTRLHRHIVIELKIADFQPEYMSKMEFYLKIADEQLKGELDEKSIGLIMVKTKDGLAVQYALRDAKNPIGIATYDINKALPENIKGELPTIAEIEQTMESELKDLRRPAEKRLHNLKERLTNLNKNEDNTPANINLLRDIYDHSLHPLFQNILTDFQTIASEFLSTRMYWTSPEKPIQSLDGLRPFWTDEAILKKYRDLIFTYHFDGLMIGLDSFNTSVELQYCMDQYFYGLKILNTREFIIRKPYTQQLSPDEMQLISDALMDDLIEKIERNLNNLPQ